MNKLNKIARYRSIHERHLHFYLLLAKQLGIGKKIQFTTLLPNIKYLGIHLTKYVQYPFTEKYRTLLRKIKDINKW